MVFEKKTAEQMRSEGVFLTLAPNGVNALRALGLAEAVAAQGIVTKGIAMFNERGRQLGLMDYGTHADAFRRAVGHHPTGALGDAAARGGEVAGIELRCRCAASTTLPRMSESVTVTSAGERRAYMRSVAADGLRSTVRRWHLPELPAPRYSMA